MQCTKILTDENNKELAVHGNYEFPCAVYFSYVSKYIAGEIDWHWHKEIEIINIYQGTLYVEIENKKFILSKGDSLFINSEEMHFMKMNTKEECVIISFVFNKSLICGDKGNNIEQKYIDPLINCKELSALELTKEDSKKLAQAYYSYSNNILGYEIIVRNILSEILLNIIRKNQKLLEKSFVTSEVALTTGFYDQSHFIRNFKKIVKMTPLEYQSSINRIYFFKEEGE